MHLDFNSVCFCNRSMFVTEWVKESHSVKRTDQLSWPRNRIFMEFHTWCITNIHWAYQNLCPLQVSNGGSKMPGDHAPKSYFRPQIGDPGERQDLWCYFSGTVIKRRCYTWSNSLTMHIGPRARHCSPLVLARPSRVPSLNCKIEYAVFTLGEPTVAQAIVDSVVRAFRRLERQGAGRWLPAVTGFVACAPNFPSCLFPWQQFGCSVRRICFRSRTCSYTQVRL